MNLDHNSSPHTGSSLTKSDRPIIHMKSVSRKSYFQMVALALDEGEYSFANEAALKWLAEFPGDLGARLAYARLLLKSANPERAYPILSYLVQADPENLETTRVFLNALSENNITGKNSGQHNKLQTTLFVLSNGSEGSAVDAWGRILLKTIRSYRNGDLDTVNKNVDKVWREAETNPLAAIWSHRLLKLGNPDVGKWSIDKLEEFHQLFPACLYFKLSLADALMSDGDHVRALSLLNQVVSKDTTGRVAARMWGKQNKYRSLWPDELVLDFDSWIPFKVSYRLGWNVLPEGDASISRLDQISDELVEGSLRGMRQNAAGSTQESQKRGNLYSYNNASTGSTNLNGSEGQDLRIPVYVIFTVKSALETKFGHEGSRLIIQEIHRLCAVMDKISGWKSLFFTPDNPALTALYNIEPAKPGDAWSLKLAVSDLDNALSTRGERIGALLIVGGADVVPFHLLPNPINDPDLVVASDNPYASADDNYYIPDWPVGRIPDGDTQTTGLLGEPGFLVKSLRQIIENNASINSCPAWYQRILQPFSTGGFFKTIWSGLRSFPSYGYVASVWEKVSESVFIPVGKPKSLLVSPPYGREFSKNGSKPLNPSTNPFDWVQMFNRNNHRLIVPPRVTGRLAYFNLHGVEDSGEWFGQRDSRDSELFPDYPVALKPGDILPGNAKPNPDIPQVVFSEACYGAHIINKDIQDAISLSFLQSGTRAVVGSTCMSYGSVSEPLIAADFLGHSFWVYLQEGYPVGEALQRAKIHLAQTMHSRQGHLDGEDQKTLISFILLGDPLAYPSPPQKCPDASWRPPEDIKNLHTVSDYDYTDEVPENMVAHVKNIVSRYLPGMVDAKFYIGIDSESNSHAPGKKSQTGLATKDQSGRENHRRITLSKKYIRQDKTHNQVALLTLSDSGKLLKLVVSR